MKTIHKSYSDSNLKDLKNTTNINNLKESYEKNNKNPKETLIPDDFMKYENLVLSSGGMLGISYIGFHKYIEENYSFDNIKTILGVSAGSVYGLVLTLGFTCQEITDIFLNLDLVDIIDLNIDKFLMMIDQKGLLDTKILKNVLYDILATKKIDPHITFKQIYDQYHKSFLIGVTNFTHYRFEILSYHNYPNMPVLDAILMSSCLPIIFKPTIFNDNLYIDGGVIAKFPIDFFDNIYSPYSTNYETIQKHYLDLDENGNFKSSIDKTFGILLSNSLDYIYPEHLEEISASSYLSVVYYLISDKENNMIKTYKNNMCQFEIPYEILHGLQLDYKRDNLLNVIDICYDYTKKRLNKKK